MFRLMLVACVVICCGVARPAEVRDLFADTWVGTDALGREMPVGTGLREGKTRQVHATLAAEKLATVEGARLDPRLTGVSFSELSQSERSQGLAGVRVTAVQPGSIAARAGLQQGDVLIGIGNRRITSVRGLQALAGVRPRQLALAIADDQGMHYVLMN